MTDFKLCNIVDSQLEDITSELSLPVVTGSTSNTYQQFNAQGGTSNSSMQFNITVPSLQSAVIDTFNVRQILILRLTLQVILKLIIGLRVKYFLITVKLTPYRRFP